MRTRSWLSLTASARGVAQSAQKPTQGTDTPAAVAIMTMEIQCLREEITTRIALMNAVIALQLAALGTGLTIIGKPSYVLGPLGAASSFLWRSYSA